MAQLSRVGRLGSMSPGGARRPTLDFNASAGAIPAPLTFSRASGATRTNARGYVDEVGVDAPRFTYDPALEYNLQANPWFDGAGPGTLPTGFGNWSFRPNTTGITAEIVGAFDEDGLRVVRVRYHSGGLPVGGTGGSITMYLGASGQDILPGGTSAQISRTVFMRTVGPVSGYTGSRLITEMANSAASWVGGDYSDVLGVPPSDLPIRQCLRSRTVTLSNAALYSLRPNIAHYFTPNSVLDVTLDLAFPTFTLAASPITDRVSVDTLAARVNGVPQYGLRGLALEGQRTNLVSNPRAEGAVAGTPGTFPAGWSTFFAPSGVSREIVGTTVIGGVECLLIRYFGTPSTNGALTLYTGNVFAAAPGDSVSVAAFVRLHAGSLTNITSARMRVFQQLGTTWVRETSTEFALDTTLRNVSHTTTTGTGIDNASPPVITLIPVAGQPIDVTLAVGLPQAELAAFASSRIRPPVGTIAASTRAFDSLSAPWSSVSRGGEATLLFSGVVPTAQTGARTLLAAYLSSVERVALRLNGGNLGIGVFTGGSPSSVSGALTGVTGTATIRAGMTIRPGRAAAFAAGGALISTTTVPPTISTFQVGAREAGNGALFGEAITVRVLPRAVSDAELQALVDALPAPAAPWTPAALGSSLALWLDASDASTITLNGSTVSQWADKSGNGRHATQAVAANQPTYTPGGLGGKDVLTFDGVNDLFELSSGILLNDNFTYVYSVLERATTGRHSVDVGRTTTPIGYGNWWFSDNVLYSNLRGNNFMTHGGSTATGTFINGLVRDNSGTQAWRNGTAFGSPVGAAVTGDLTLNAIGRAQGGSAAVHNGPMAEVVVGRGALSTADRQKLEGYLAWKWGLEGNLPSGHPYQLAPPTL